MENQGFSLRSLILVCGALGALAGGFLGSRIDHQIIFLGLWSGMLGAFGLLIGIAVGYFISNHQ